MNFLSIGFILFFLLTFSLSLPFRRTKWYTWYVLLASLIFYSFFSLNSLLLLIVHILINYFGNWMIWRAKWGKKFWLCIFLIFNIVFLAFFKYSSSILNLSAALSPFFTFRLVTDQMITLFGISYITFKSISHLVETYKAKIELPGLVTFAAYVSFFPQIGAGPIQRPNQFYLQLCEVVTSPLNLSTSQLSEILILTLSGMIKKLLLGTILFNFAQDPIQAPWSFSQIDLVLTTLTYTLFIYFDFSGYSDLANALSLLLGFKKVANFNHPYLSTSVIDFWNRWHISFSSWIRDYIYIPLGGNADGELHRYSYIIITMLIGGLWHGASWTFLLWGGWHALGVIFSHFIETKFNFQKRVLRLLSWFSTFIFINLSWIFFFSPSLDISYIYLRGLLGNTIVSRLDNPLLYVILIIGLAIIFLEKFIGRFARGIFDKVGSKISLLIFMLLIFVVSWVMPKEIPLFIYFGF